MSRVQETSLPPRAAHVLERLRHMRLWLLLVLGLVAIGLFPWTAYLSATLPSKHITHHWQVAWTGFDLFEAAALVATFVAMLKRSPLVTIVASVAGTALLCDAWFDLVTASPGGSSTRPSSLRSWRSCRSPRCASGLLSRSARSSTLSSPRTRLGQLALRPQSSQTGPRQAEPALVHEVARLPTREELRVEAVEPLDLEEAVGQQQDAPPTRRSRRLRGLVDQPCEDGEVERGLVALPGLASCSIARTTMNSVSPFGVSAVAAHQRERGSPAGP